MKHKSSSILLEKQLLNDYQTGDFFLASPKRTILGKGTFAVVPNEKETNNQIQGLTKRVSNVLEGAKKHGHINPVVVGAIPFDYKSSAQLIVPETVQQSTPLKFNSGDHLTTSTQPTYEIKAIPEPEQYEKGVEKGINYIKIGHLEKIVLSRSLYLNSSEAVDINQLLHNLAQHNNHGYTFAVDLSKDISEDSNTNTNTNTKSTRTLIGASPELLVSRTGGNLLANPLAGSRPRSKDPFEDQRRATELLSSAKDLHEHAVVVQAVAEALQPYCKTIDVPSEPSLVHTETMWHLSTEIKGEVADSLTSSLELALALHPTPAVCGSPTEVARAAIQEIEPFERGFFTGMVGWCDSNGEGEWVVTIRCAEVEQHSLRLFAGAGVVAESKPEEELAETSAKFRTMLLAMGIDKELLISTLEE
ncbi:isochorismate synthase DhbC [Priestia aryabhattai]|uniref:isochorismate synthase DhbC n=1 Tax=Priestia aryabhattai TaxID=412384 RepID=UPI001C0D6C21|nr:isochorismate synthase DhbC [Priestia aryabhattai]MBU3574195.1 isochorismate synthase DhbC [Priestia aryabhattai]